MKPIPLNKQELNALITKMPFNHHLGLKVTRVWADGITLECAILDTFRNGLGTLHGGVTATLVDVAAGLATIGFSGGRAATTVELKTNYLRPAVHGKVHARSRIRKAGKTLTFVEVEIKDDHGHLVATGTATYMTLEGGFPGVKG
ncbi:MAG: PaaI family thioesterase [Acidobacteria bacterium]|nr:PaaI family thioesterase [Acidobacteriota bacterium]